MTRASARLHSLFVLTAVVVLGLAGAANASGREVRYAIVIGNNAPPSSGTSETLQPLRYADDDAVRYYQLFARLGEAHLLVVMDTDTQKRYPGLAAIAQPPTVGNLTYVVGQLASAMQRDRARGDRPILYFAFSGHGARGVDGQPFLALLDGRLTQDALYTQYLGRMPSTFTHLIVDACHAGGVVGVRGGDFFAHEEDTRAAPTTTADIEPILRATPLANYPQIGVLLATTQGQEAYEWSAIESGIFTHELLSGLSGAADVNGDGVVEYTEIQAFIAAANRDIPDPRAIPFVVARPPAANQNVGVVAPGDLAGTRVLRGNATGLGHFTIELANGQRYLDAHVASDPAAIAIPDGDDMFVRTATREARLPSHGAVSISDLRWQAAGDASRGSLEVTYRTALFATPYGPAYYRGFVDSTGGIGVRFADPAVVAARSSRRERRKHLAIAGLAVAGASGAAALVFGSLAYDAHADFASTTLQREAQEAKDRYDRDLPVAIAATTVAVVAGAAAWWLWPRVEVHVAPAALRGGVGLSVGGSW